MHGRGPSLILAVGLAALAAILAFIAIDGLLEGWRAYAGGAARVPVRLGAAAGVAATLSLAALAAILLFERHARGLFRLALVSLPGLLLLPLALALVSAPLLDRAGYARCPGNASERLTLRWCR